MTSLSEFFFNSKIEIAQLDLIEISHPSFSKTYRIVRNAVNGFSAVIDGTLQPFVFYPLAIKGTSVKDDLDQAISVSLGDLGELIPSELDRVRASGRFDIKPTVRYWTFRSDDPTSPLYGPVVLNVTEFSSDISGSSFEAKAPSLNVSKTGEIYDLSRFPGLRGFL